MRAVTRETPILPLIAQASSLMLIDGTTNSLGYAK